MIAKKQAEHPTEKENGFYSQQIKHKFTNIKIYDTVILLRVLASQSQQDLGAYLDEFLNELEDLVNRRKMLESKQEQYLELIAKKQELDKNLKVLREVNTSIEEVGRKLGALETNLATIANSKGIPNAFEPTLATKEVWESLANMFEVLNQPQVQSQTYKTSEQTTVSVQENSNENTDTEQNQ